MEYLTEYRILNNLNLTPSIFRVAQGIELSKKLREILEKKVAQ